MKSCKDCACMQKECASNCPFMWLNVVDRENMKRELSLDCCVSIDACEMCNDKEDEL